MKVKPGIQTTEFLAVLAAGLEGVGHWLTSNPDANYSTMALAGLYAVARTVLKLKAS